MFSSSFALPRWRQSQWISILLVEWPILFKLFCNNPYYWAEKAMAPHSSTLAWKIPWMEEPGRLVVHGVAKSQTQLSDFTSIFHFHALEKEMATHSSILAWRIPGTGEPGGLLSVGAHRVGHDWSDLAAAVTIERVPRQVDKSRVSEEAKGVWNSQGGGKDKLLFFSSTFLSLSHIKLFFFPLSQELMITQQTQFELCTRDYITTVYSAWGQFLLPENFLTNPGILECILWEWVW